MCFVFAFDTYSRKIRERAKKGSRKNRVQRSRRYERGGGGGGGTLCLNLVNLHLSIGTLTLRQIVTCAILPEAIK